MKYLIVILLYLVFTSSVLAGQHYKTPPLCIESPTPTPTILDDITPTASQEATPSVKIETTASNSTNSSISEASNDTTHNSNPTCDTPKPDKVAWFTYDAGVKGDGKIALNWALPQRAHTVNICYSRAQHFCEYGVSGVPNNGHYEIGSLDNVPYWFSLQSQDGCATSEYSNWIDPLN